MDRQTHIAVSSNGKCHVFTEELHFPLLVGPFLCTVTSCNSSENCKLLQHHLRSGVEAPR